MAKRRKQPQTTKHTIEGAVSNALSTLEELASEMREAYDNTPENLQQTSVGEARGEAADALENLDQPDVPDSVGEIEFEYTFFPLKARASRSARRDEATSLLQAVIDALNDIEGANADDAESLRVALENLVSDAEAVEFPGMYG